LTSAKDFGSIVKEFLKQATKWSAKYFIHPSSYYPVPKCKTSFAELLIIWHPFPQWKCLKKANSFWETGLNHLDQYVSAPLEVKLLKDKAGTLPSTMYLKECEHQCIDLERTESHGSLQVGAHESDEEAKKVPRHERSWWYNGHHWQESQWRVHHSWPQSMIK